jgi:hypothetical protein
MWVVSLKHASKFLSIRASCGTADFPWSNTVEDDTHVLARLDTVDLLGHPRLGPGLVERPFLEFDELPVDILLVSQKFDCTWFLGCVSSMGSN